MSDTKKCPSCSGSGEAGTCDECGGSGWVVRVESDVARLACRNATQECTLEELRIQVERLTKERDYYRKAYDACLASVTEQDAEIERLTAAIAEARRAALEEAATLAEHWAGSGQNIADAIRELAEAPA